MTFFWETLLGLDRGFLDREGSFALRFHPAWPLADLVGHGLWNLLLVGAALLFVFYVYRRERKTRPWRIGLGALRFALLVVVIVMLNRPAVSLTQTRVEPSVLAVLVDESLSMQIRDEVVGGAPASRLEAVQAALGGGSDLLAGLTDVHRLRLYAFGDGVRPLDAGDDGYATALAALGPRTGSTRIVQSVHDVLRDLRGQNLAGLVLLTDGREAPARIDAQALLAVEQAGVPVHAVAVGSDDEPLNLEVQSVVVQDTAFAGDIVNVVAQVRLSGGGEAATGVTVRLVDPEGNPVTDPDGQPVERQVELAGDTPTRVELPLETVDPGTLTLAVQAVPLPGEIDESDNVRPLQVDVLDAQVNVLYVDGYPRWEYRFLKNQLIRDSTVDVSVLLTSADPTFAQEGNTPVQRFPVSLEELLEYDVILLGDVSPRQFSDGQLQIIEEFVGNLGGGLGMVAGPRFSPWEWRGTPVERILPVDVVSNPSASLVGGTLAEGFRPVLTEAGHESGLFRFEPTREENEQFLATRIQPLFWWADGIGVKPGVGEVLARHPSATGPDGRPAPLVVAGRFGAGRTLFGGLDETWRWRFYTGESVFDTYWVQTVRHLARGRKLGERRLVFTTSRPSYELGGQAAAEVRLLDASLVRQLPDRVDAELRDADDRPVQTVTLTRRGDGEEAARFTGTFPATRVGNFTLHLPPLAAGLDAASTPVVVDAPRLELSRASADRPFLRNLAEQTSGRFVELVDVAALNTIDSAERRVPIVTSRSLWDAPLGLAVFALLVTAEWVGRKMAGLV